jgi:molybdopterin/thiamine biosynthesis adenylyltransferase
VGGAADTCFALIGAGGLGGPVAYALAAAGAGRLVLCDHDRVELSNLQRQVQFTTADVGRRKVDALAGELVRRGFPAERIRRLPVRFARDTADEVLDGVDVLVEGSDDPATKFAANDEAMARSLRLAVGGVERYGGQVLAAVPGRGGCYRCLFEEPPAAEESPSCADAGVLGAAVAAIGGLLARAALDLAAGQDGAAGELLVVDDVGSRSPPRRVRYKPRLDCTACRPADPRPAAQESP